MVHCLLPRLGHISLCTIFRGFSRRNCPLLNFPHTYKNNPILRAETIQVPEVALFLRGDFPVWFAPIFQYCGFISSIHPLLRLDEAFLPELLIISLSLLALIIFDKYWSKAAVARIRSNTFISIYFIHVYIHIILIYIFLYIVFIKI